MVIDKIQPSYKIFAAVQEELGAFDPSGRLQKHIPILIRTHLLKHGFPVEIALSQVGTNMGTSNSFKC